MSLAEFEKTQRPRRRCAMCVVRDARPELWAEVVAGRAKPAPTPYRIIAAYLTRQGVPVPMHQVRDHFLAHETEDGR